MTAELCDHGYVPAECVYGRCRASDEEREKFDRIFEWMKTLTPCMPLGAGD